MKYTALIAAVLVGLITAAETKAQNYFELKLGHGEVQDSEGLLDPGFPADEQLFNLGTRFGGSEAYSVEVGRRFDDILRGGVELVHRPSTSMDVEGLIVTERNEDGAPIEFGPFSVTGGSIQTTALMGNLYFDLPLSDRFSPYFGVGAGVAMVDYDIGSFNGRMWRAAYQGMLGLAVKVTSTVSLTGQYGVFIVDDPDIGASKTDYEWRGAFVGLRKSF